MQLYPSTLMLKVHPVARIFSVNYSVVVAVSSVGEAHHGKARVRARISSIESTSHWKNCIGARPPNLLSHGMSSAPSVQGREGRKAPSSHAAPVAEGVFGSRSARWDL